MVFEILSFVITFIVGYLAFYIVFGRRAKTLFKKIQYNSVFFLLFSILPIFMEIEYISKRSYVLFTYFMLYMIIILIIYLRREKYVNQVGVKKRYSLFVTQKKGFFVVLGGFALLFILMFANELFLEESYSVFLVIIISVFIVLTIYLIIKRSINSRKMVKETVMIVSSTSGIRVVDVTKKFKFNLKKITNSKEFNYYGISNIIKYETEDQIELIHIFYTIDVLEQINAINMTQALSDVINDNKNSRIVVDNKDGKFYYEVTDTIDIVKE